MAWESEHLWNAVEEAVVLITKIESEWDSNKLKKKIRDYFRKGSKGLDFEKKPWYELINDYADAVFSTLFASLGERAWLSEVDFLLVLDAGVRDTFPSHVLAEVPRQLFERTVLAAHDRAFEEQRFLPILWMACQTVVQGDKTRKKVYQAIDLGRKEADSCCEGPEVDSSEVENFMCRWVDRTLSILSAGPQGEPNWVLPPDKASRLFRSLVQAGALPHGQVQRHGAPPSDIDFLDRVVRQTYQAHGKADEAARGPVKDEGGEQTSKRLRTSAGGGGDGIAGQ